MNREVVALGVALIAMCAVGAAGYAAYLRSDSEYFVAASQRDMDPAAAGAIRFFSLLLPFQIMVRRRPLVASDRTPGTSPHLPRTSPHLSTLSMPCPRAQSSTTLATTRSLPPHTRVPAYTQPRDLQPTYPQRATRGRRCRSRSTCRLSWSVSSRRT